MVFFLFCLIDVWGITEVITRAKAGEEENLSLLLFLWPTFHGFVSQTKIQNVIIHTLHGSQTLNFLGPKMLFWQLSQPIFQNDNSQRERSVTNGFKFVLSLKEHRLEYGKILMIYAAMNTDRGQHSKLEK